ncbi:glycosyltransferase family 39 protein [Duganella sp. HH105]|uniref:DUF7024 domain-containing protein n=1 Tax=Duganella sp. HH105 TaxID=1781067 RepID=UPI000877B1A5|nr:glycosyltransferase family 39 protein [Duganella sp. HH105]OEZ56207.1 phosphoglycerol transferase I [Duganella sp. HH105]
MTFLRNFFADPRRAPPFLVGALVLIFIFLTLRNAGIYPLVFVDEWTYSSNTRMMPLSAAQVPSYLYFKLYQLTNYCGDGYLECNRMLNSALYVLAAPFLYLLARRVAPAWVAVLVALAATLSPNNVYTPFFMPEAMYYFGFWCFCWMAFVFADRPGAGRALLLGAVLGLLLMVKMHAIFLGPALALFLFFLAWDGRAAAPARHWLLQGALWSVLALAAAMTLRLAIGYWLAGRDGLALFGSIYAGQVAYTAKSHYPVAQLIAFAWHNLQGHLMLLALLFGVPLAALAGSFSRLRPAGAPARRLQAVSVFSVLMLGTVLGVTIMFTASITGLAASDSTARIHTRYYDFALPLMLLCAAAAAYAPAAPLKTTTRAAIAAVVLLLVWHGRAHLLHSFTPSIIDSPELRALSMEAGLFNIITAVTLVSLLRWVHHQQKGMRLFFVFALPVIVGCCAWNAAREVRLSIWPDTASKAGLFARHYLDRSQSDKLVIVSDDVGILHRSRFFIENPNAQFMQVEHGKEADWSKLPAGYGWVLAIGAYVPPEGARVAAHKDDLLLFQPPARDARGQRLDFTQVLEDYVRINGLAGHDTWGAWSVESKVEMEFGRPLPKRLGLRVEGRAFGPNAGQDIVVTVGGQERMLRLPALGGDVTLHFDTDGTATRVRFKVPQPTSHKQMGLDDDTRTLGIGFEHLTVIDEAQ